VSVEVARMKRALRALPGRVIGAVVSRGAEAYFSSYYYSRRWHPHYALLQEALAETVEYIKANMSQAMIRRDARAVLADASRQVVHRDGLYLEFGVRTGSSINHIARMNRHATVYGFDSFEGLPERWTGWTMDAGTFGGEGVPQVEPNVRLEIGWFDDTLPGFLDAHEGDVGLVHVDSDIYSSARTVLTQLAPRIRPGTIIVFNEYFNYPNWREHEFRAFQEFCAEHDVSYEYLCWGLYEVAVRIESIRGERR
jgi:hypothetical protein